MSNVVGLCGHSIVLPGEPDEELIAMLERHLADAKSGKSVACAIASVDEKGWCLTTFALSSHRFTLAGAIANLQHKLQTAIEGDDEN